MGIFVRIISLSCTNRGNIFSLDNTERSVCHYNFISTIPRNPSTYGRIYKTEFVRIFVQIISRTSEKKSH